MDDPRRNIPRAIVVVMLLVSAFYFLIMTVSIGVLGPDLAETKTPIATAAAVFLGTAAACSSPPVRSSPSAASTWPRPS